MQGRIIYIGIRRFAATQPSKHILTAARSAVTNIKKNKLNKD